MQNALEAADRYTEIADRHRNEVTSEPSELIRQSIVTMERAREAHANRRVEIEADHRTRLEELEMYYGKQKDQMTLSIHGLEQQLALLRDQWSKLCNDEVEERRLEKERWSKHDTDQRKLIAAEEAMITQLRS